MSRLTDQQYFSLLKKVEDAIRDPDLVLSGYDSTYPGDHELVSNFGMCNDEGFCDKDLAMWPDKFPDRKSIKHQEEWQLCPADSRLFSWRRLSRMDRFQGCFYSCLHFSHRLPQHIIKPLMLVGIEYIPIGYQDLKIWCMEDYERFRREAAEERALRQKYSGVVGHIRRWCGR